MYKHSLPGLLHIVRQILPMQTNFQPLGARHHGLHLRQMPLQHLIQLVFKPIFCPNNIWKWKNIKAGCRVWQQKVSQLTTSVVSHNCQQQCATETNPTTSLTSEVCSRVNLRVTRIHILDVIGYQCTYLSILGVRGQAHKSSAVFHRWALKHLITENEEQSLEKHAHIFKFIY